MFDLALMLELAQQQGLQPAADVNGVGGFAPAASQPRDDSLAAPASQDRCHPGPCAHSEYPHTHQHGHWHEDCLKKSLKQ